MTSNFQKKTEAEVEVALNQLVPQVTGFFTHQAGQQNFLIAVKFASSNLKHHSFPDTDKMNVQRKFDGILQKLSILCKPELSTYLGNLFQSLKKKKLRDDYPDIHFRVLDVLLNLSGNLVEYNQERIIPENSLELNLHQTIDEQSDGEQENDQVMMDWGKFETSSEEIDSSDSDIEPKVRSVKKQRRINEDRPRQQNQGDNVQDNLLYHISNPKIRSYSEFLQKNTPVSNLNQYQLYQPETQNLSIHLHLSKQQEQYSLRSLVKTTERDIVASILYAFLEQDTDLLILQEFTSMEREKNYKNKHLNTLDNLGIKLRGFTLNQDICVTHMSVSALQNHIEQILIKVNIVNFLKQLTKSSLQNLTNKVSLRSNLGVEDKVQEAFWSCINEICGTFNNLIIQLQRRILLQNNEDLEIFYDETTNHKHPLTLLQMDHCLQSQMKLIGIMLELCIQVCQFLDQKQESIFSSTTLTILADYCDQQALLADVQILRPLLKTFLYTLQPYCSMLDHFLDFHNFVDIHNWNTGQFIPKFVLGVVQELQAIGSGYQIYTKIQNENQIIIDEHQLIQKTDFSKLLQESLISKLNIKVELKMKDILKFTEILDLNENLDRVATRNATRENSASKLNEEIDYGPYDIYKNSESFISSGFNLVKYDPPEEEISQQCQQFLLSDISDYLSRSQMQNFSITLNKIFQQIIQTQHNMIQEKLLSILFQKLHLLEVMKFLRTLYFFERIDVMNFVIEKVSEGSQGLGRLRAFQQQLKELLLEYNVTSKNLIDKFQFQVEFGNQKTQQDSLSLLNPRNFLIKMNLNHPLDLIVDENSMLLYNKIMQLLIFFKNAKFNLQNAHAILKKRIGNVQFKRKQKQKVDEELDQSESPFLLNQSNISYKPKQYQMYDEIEAEQKKINITHTRKLWIDMCHFAYEMMSFMNSYEYFLFESVISQQTKIYEESLGKQKDFQSIINLHINYLKTIADKIFLNKKTEQILETVNVLLNAGQNLPLLVSRVSSLEIVDNATIKIETQRAASELEKMRDNYSKALQTLIVLFDKSERKAYAPEMIEAIFKSNFNRFYQQKEES